MRRIFKGAFGFALAAAMAVSACTEQAGPVGLESPSSGAALDVFGTASDGAHTASDTTALGGVVSAVDATVSLMKRDVPLAAAITVTQTIGTTGGRIEIPQAGFKIHVPNGALSQPTTITVTALAGAGVAYDFQPHGIVFAKPLVATQSFRVIGADVPLVRGGYFAADSDVDMRLLKGRIKERMPSEMKLSESKVKFNIPHFSGYLLSID